MGAHEVVDRLMEDPSRKDDPALTALVNKMLQDPSTAIRAIALSIVDSRSLLGDDTTVKILCPKCKTGGLNLLEANEHKFYGCSNYPYCDYTNNHIRAVKENHRCKVCGDFMVIRKGKFGVFYGCSKYPKCNYTEDIKRNK